MDTADKLEKAKAKAKKVAETKSEAKSGGEANGAAEIKVAALLGEAADAIEGIAAELESA